MKSIRTYLLLALLATIISVTFLSLLEGYRSSLSKTDSLFDERLKNLASIIVHANHDTSPRIDRFVSLEPTVFFQIWSNDGILIARSSNAPVYTLYSGAYAEGFHDVNFEAFRWRTFVLWDTLLNRWVITGERIDLRYEIADNIVLSAIMPTVLAIPVAALIIWFAVGFGLKPLRELTKQLSHKQADDLSPIVVQNTPEEISQLVLTTNDLLQRLNAAFMREQQFSADAAHELRTPISALKVQLHNVLTNSAIADEDIQPLKEGVERMGHVVEQILALYRYSPDQALQQMVEVDLVVVGQTIIANEYNKFDTKHQYISLIGDKQGLVKGSPFALESLLQNLILNANKYTPEHGKIIVSVDVKDAHVLLTVEDSGPGIDKKDYDRVFERFYRVDGDQHASGTLGCGLGLAIVQHIAIMHHATISLGLSPTLGGLKISLQFPSP
ncbi:MAG: ATP-binding protein [Cycloclasticus sp.]|nr:ATP-binding protein [Cycloclasticus sp.]